MLKLLMYFMTKFNYGHNHSVCFLRLTLLYPGSLGHTTALGVGQKMPPQLSPKPSLVCRSYFVK